MWQARSKSLPNQGGVDIQFKGMTSAFVQTVKINGVTGLWRGLTANLLKVDIFTYSNLFGFAWCMRIIKTAWLKNSANQTWCICHGKIQYHFHQPHSKLKHSFGVSFASLQGSWLSFLGMSWEVTHTSSERLNLTCMFSHRLLHSPLKMESMLVDYNLRVHWGGLRDKPKEPRCGRLHRLKVFPPSAYSLSVH